ncbi:hypothetical protein Tco_0126773 [Tanacetum coccineum]
MSSPRFNRLKNMRVMPVASRRCELLYIMVDLNIPTNDAPVEQAPAVAPPTRTDDQILPLSNCQLDEQWFNFHKDLLRDALDTTPTNDNNPFVASPSSDTIIEYVNTLGYPSMLRNVSAMSVNALYQPWRDVLSMINMCLTDDDSNVRATTHLTTKTKHSTILQPSKRFRKETKSWLRKTTDEPSQQKVCKGWNSGRPESNARRLVPENTLTYSEMKLDEEMPVINIGDQDEGQAGPNPGKQDEGHAGPNPGIQDEGQARSNPGDAASLNLNQVTGFMLDQTVNTWT